MRRAPLLALLLFAVLTVVFAYPYVLNMGTMVKDPVDPLLSTWTMLWDRHILLGGPTAWPSLFDANIFFPYRATLAFSEHLLGNMALALPLITTHPSPFFALNSIVLLSFVLSGFGTWLLVVYWTGDRRAASLAGIMFAFSSTRLIVLGQLNLVGIQWMPFTLLALHLYLDKNKWQRWLLCAVFLNLQLFSAINYSMHIAFLVAIFVIGYGIAHYRRVRLSLLGGLAALALITLLVNSPIWRVYLLTGQSLSIQRDLGAVRFFSAGLSDYLRVAPQSPWYGLWSPPPTPANKLPAPLFPGALAILLGLVGGLAIAFRPPRRGRWFPFVVPTMWLLAASGFSLSLGANEQAFGPGMASLLRVVLPYPWLWKYMPGVQGFRAPARFAILFFLALSVLSGLAFAALARRLGSRRWQMSLGLTTLLAAFLCFENFYPPLTGSHYPFGGDIPAIYSWLRQTEPDAVVQEFPFYTALQGHGRETERMYYSYQHWRRLVNGSSGYNPASLRNLGYVMGPFPSWQSIETMQRLGVDYALLHPADYEREFGADAWPQVWSRLPMFLPSFSHMWQVGADYVLQLPPSNCTDTSDELVMNLSADEVKKGEGLSAIIEFTNPGVAAFVSDPNRPSQLTARWWQDDQMIGEEQLTFHEPLLVLPAETAEVVVHLPQPVEGLPDKLELVASPHSLERQLTGQFTLLENAVPGESGEPITTIPPNARLADPVPFEGGIRLVGYSLETNETTTCQSIPLTLYWELSPTGIDEVRAGIGLANRFGHTDIESWVHLRQDGTASQLVADKRTLPIPGPLPAGQYTLNVRVQKPDQAPLPAHTADGAVDSLPLGTIVVRPQPPERSPGEWQSVGASVADTVMLVAYRLDHTRFSPGDWVRLTLLWQAQRAPERAATVFTQLIGPDGQVWAQQDNPPRGGSYPTTLWEAGEIVSDDYLLKISPDAPPGRYTLVTGMYLPDSLERLPIKFQTGEPTLDAIMLTQIELD